ncbi:hypothetical protein [Nocardiopsis rhodophaea]|uniref:hypothetical protein n=1 Tax=Nocardiopsis rhodophaea TaxID=280238 RepID=UPI0031E39312
MTGPEHYREAERLTGLANATGHGDGGEYTRDTLAAAQVHATLALAAATSQSASIDSEPEFGMATAPPPREHAREVLHAAGIDPNEE